jgi:hypothetical protein
MQKVFLSFQKSELVVIVHVTFYEVCFGHLLISQNTFEANPTTAAFTTTTLVLLYVG